MARGVACANFVGFLGKIERLADLVGRENVEGASGVLVHGGHAVWIERGAGLGAGITDGDYRFTPDGPGDEPAPGKGIKQEAIEGSFLHTGPGQYQAPPSYLLIRGDPNSKGPQMQPGFIRAVTYGNPAVTLTPSTPNTSGRRLALAEWLVDAKNPLTRRSIVNRVWQYHFGRGIVATPSDFGRNGIAPSNPKLLDFLADEFAKNGESIKKLSKLILTSATYKQSSANNEKAAAIDTDNVLLWRMNRSRLEAEEVRDAHAVRLEASERAPPRRSKCGRGRPGPCSSEPPLHSRTPALPAEACFQEQHNKMRRETRRPRPWYRHS